MVEMGAASGDSTFIFVLKHEHGHLTFRKSNNPSKKLQQLQRHSPYQFTIGYKFKVRGDWRVVKRKLYEYYSEYKHDDTDWFKDIPQQELRYLYDIRSVDSSMAEKDDWNPKYHVKKKANTHGKWAMSGLYDSE